jgi:hypothetical protein
MQGCIAEKVFAGALIKTYFYDFAGGICIRERKIPEPVVRVHAITAACAASAIAFASSWFSAFGGTAITTSHRSANF